VQKWCCGKLSAISLKNGSEKVQFSKSEEVDIKKMVQK
jgi:hypothetical protein